MKEQTKTQKILKNKLKSTYEIIDDIVQPILDSAEKNKDESKDKTLALDTRVYSKIAQGAKNGIGLLLGAGALIGTSSIYLVAEGGRRLAQTKTGRIIAGIAAAGTITYFALTGNEDAKTYETVSTGKLETFLAQEGQVNKGNIVYGFLGGELGIDAVLNQNGSYKKLRDIQTPDNNNAYNMLRNENPELNNLNKIRADQEIRLKDYNKNGKVDYVNTQQEAANRAKQKR